MVPPPPPHPPPPPPPPTPPPPTPPTPTTPPPTHHPHPPPPTPTHHPPPPPHHPHPPPHPTPPPPPPPPTPHPTPLGTNFTEIRFKTQNFSFMKMHLKTSSEKWWPFCPGGDGLWFRNWYQYWGHFCYINDLGSSPQVNLNAHICPKTVTAYNMVTCAHLGVMWPYCFSLVTRVATTVMSQWGLLH